MPLIQVQTTVALGDAERREVLEALSGLVARTIGKPEQYVMAVLQPAAILMSGQAGEAAWVEVRSIGGLNANINRQLSSQICALLHGRLRIAPERVYLNFVEVQADRWGWRGQTFG